MPLFYVKIRKNIDICNYLPIYYPAICRGYGTFSVPSQGEGVLSCCVLGGLMWLLPLGEGWDGASCWLVRTPGNSEPIATPYYIYTLRCIVVSMVSLMGRGDDTKSFVPFQGFALCVCVWWRIFPRTGSRISATTHRHACPVAG